MRLRGTAIISSDAAAGGASSAGVGSISQWIRARPALYAYRKSGKGVGSTGGGVGEGVGVGRGASKTPLRVRSFPSRASTSSTRKSAPLPSLLRKKRESSLRWKGRAPRRPKTTVCPPVSSTTRSRSSPRETAIASPCVGKVAINLGFGRGLKPCAPGTVSGEINCTTRRPFFPSATSANIDALTAPTCTARVSLSAPPALNICSSRGCSGFSTSTIARPSAPLAT